MKNLWAKLTCWWYCHQWQFDDEAVSHWYGELVHDGNFLCARCGKKKTVRERYKV